MSKKPSLKDVFTKDQFSIKNLVKNDLEKKIMFKALDSKTGESFTFTEKKQDIDKLITEIYNESK